MAYRLSRPALHDLDDIWSYVAQRDRTAARRQIATIIDRILVLATHPFLGRAREALLPELRSVPAGHYVIFYRIVRDEVSILRVLHGRRDIENIL